MNTGNKKREAFIRNNFLSRLLMPAPKGISVHTGTKFLVPSVLTIKKETVSKMLKAINENKDQQT